MVEQWFLRIFVNYYPVINIWCPLYQSSSVVTINYTAYFDKLCWHVELLTHGERNFIWTKLIICQRTCIHSCLYLASIPWYAVLMWGGFLAGVRNKSVYNTGAFWPTSYWFCFFLNTLSFVKFLYLIDNVVNYSILKNSAKWPQSLRIIWAKVHYFLSAGYYSTNSIFMFSWFSPTLTFTLKCNA